MADGEECDSKLLTMGVHIVLDVHTNGAGALIQDSELWSVVEHPRHLGGGGTLY